MLLVQLHETLTVATYVGMDVEGIDGIDAQGKYLLGKLFTRTGGCSQNGNVNVLQLADVLYYVIGSQFGGFVGCAVSAYYTCYLEIFGCLKRLNSELSDVAVTYDGCSDFLHIVYSLGFIILAAKVKNNYEKRIVFSKKL